MNSVSESIAQGIVYLENAIDVWNELKERFSQGDLIRVSDLQCEIYALKQGSLSVTEYFSELKALWEELETYQPEPSCGCPRKCVCVTGISLAKQHHAQNKIIRFLTVLNENYAMVKSQILIMEQLPKLNKVFSMVIQHERQICNSDDEKTVIAAADGRKFFKNNKGSFQSGGSKNTSKVCTFCGRTGHTVDTCYKKHGVPPNWQKSAAIVTDEVTEQKEDHDSKTIGITKEQYEKLVNMIQGVSMAQNSNASKPVNMIEGPSTSSNLDLAGNILQICSLIASTFGLWILDSGASVHICSSLKYFKSYMPIKPVSIKLPNGQKTCATFKGVVEFTPKLYIVDVLYVPDFYLNLISVPRLMIDLQASVLFDLPKSIIQDMKTKEMIGSGMIYDGLVYLDLSDSADATAATISEKRPETSSLPNTALWHFRLGHVSNQRMKLMHDVFPSIHVDEGAVCDI